MIQDARLITCILPKGVAVPLAAKLKAELGIVAANVNNARGTGRITPLGYRELGAQSEKEILTVVAAGSRAEEVFEWIFQRAEIDRPHGGMVYMHRLGRSSEFVLPDLPEED